MTPDETTRIKFAERQGWKYKQSSDYKHGSYSWWKDGVEWDHPEGASSTDHNHVHAALMDLTGLEWSTFGNLVWFQIKSNSHHPVSVVIETIQIPLPTLVSCYLEATKGRVKTQTEHDGGLYE